MKFPLETQKQDKHLLKQLDADLNNTQLNLNKLLTVQNEWTRLEDVLMTEQKWLDEVGISILDLTKTTSNNCAQFLSNTQVIQINFNIFHLFVKKNLKIFNYLTFYCIKYVIFFLFKTTIIEVVIHYEKLLYLREIIEKLQDQIDVKPLLYICEQHTNDTFKLKNNLRNKEIRLIAFEKQFNKFNSLKNNAEISLSKISASLESTSPNYGIVDYNVRQ